MSWKTYNGDGRPCPASAMVDVELCNGKKHHSRLAQSLDWNRNDEHGIVAWRHVDTAETSPERVENQTESVQEPRAAKTAQEFCQKAVFLMGARGETYDKDGKRERSMASTVAAFNAITGRDLSEPEGWLLLSLLKRVRQYQSPSFHRDSAEDAVAYAALEAESLATEDNP
jgi:hypothetical protein